MTSIQSLGLHEPSALPYLVAESILPRNPPSSRYKWTVSQVTDDHGHGLVEEEILIAGSSVVWSRNGAIQRALNLSIEDDPVLHAFMTTFDSVGDGHTTTTSQHQSSERGLVVFLKTQAHIFLLSGDSHVLPLSFEVESAHPGPSGFIIQRKLGEDETREHGEQSSTLHGNLSTISETLTSVGDATATPPLVPPSGPRGTPQTTRSSGYGMPRTFSLTQVMSELGLVVWSPHRKGEALDGCKALPRSERLLFVSGRKELGVSGTAVGHPCVALTLNESTATFTVWQVSAEGAAQTEKKGDTPPKPRASLRKSSNVYGRDLGAPPQSSWPPGGLRDSLVGSVPHFADEGVFPSLGDQKSLGANDLASQLGLEFGEIGVQTRSARRVSSMLARTDLGSGTDRNMFNDLALGHSTRQSLNRPGRRGESTGSFHDRQSFGFRRRSSFPATASNFSTATSFLDGAARGLLDDLDPLRPPPDDSFDGSESNLPREIGFFKIKEFRLQSSSDASNLDPDMKFLVLKHPDTTARHKPHTSTVYICVLDKRLEEMALVKILVRVHMPRPHKERSSPPHGFEVKATALQRLPGIRDVCKVTDMGFERLVVLTQSRSPLMAVQLEAPWSAPFRMDLPKAYAIHDPALGTPPGPQIGDAVAKSLPGKEVQIQELFESGYHAQIYATDQDSRRHAIRLQLAPRDALVSDILNMCDLLLRDDQQESLLVAFWEVSRWLRSREPAITSEWMAMVVVIFSLGVPFISKQTPTTPGRRKKAALMRSSSGSAVDLTDFNALRDDEYDASLDVALSRSTWGWLLREQSRDCVTTPKSKQSRASDLAAFHDPSGDSKNMFLIKAIALAKEYVQTPVGENALGPEGYLPISINRDREHRCYAIPKILLGLHLLYEERKLASATDSKTSQTRDAMVFVLVQLGQWLGWKDWGLGPTSPYVFDFGNELSCVLDDTVIDGLRMPGQPFTPPSIYHHLEQRITGVTPPAFLTLAKIAEADAGDVFRADDAVWQKTARLTPRTIALLSFVDAATDQSGTQDIVSLMRRSGIHGHILETLPDGVAAAFHQAIATKCHHTSEKPGPADQTPDRDSHSFGNDLPNQSHRMHLTQTHEATKDYHTICASALEAEALQRWDASSEADRHTITKLIFNKDRRFPEASKLVNQTRPPLVECNPEPEWSEVELLEAQKELAQHVTRRTLSVAAGRGMMHFNARVPLLTERVPIPAFSLQCVMKPRNASESTQAMTFSAEKTTFTEEKVCWAFFHNGASMGLMISSDAPGIDTSWILYNRPPELTNRHAGFLLALGLNGHLKSLAKWVAFKYLTPKHTMTSIGLLLGLSASFLGTMDTLVTRLLSVHVTRLLPPGAAELNLSPLTQTTGMIGIGLLYYNSQHRRMSEVMLSELENAEPEEGIVSEPILRDEGYRLAAGYAFGLINLGKGNHLHALHDLNVVERLLTIAVGTKNVNLVHVLDRATAGAVMAIAFVFLKTNNEAIAQKVDVPDTLHQFEYVRPDIFLLRTLARHLIMWDSIQATRDFYQASLPAVYRRRASLKSTKLLSTEDLPYFNILAGISFAIGLRYAGSHRLEVRDLLLAYLDQFLRLSRLPAHSYDARVTLNGVRNCLDTVALAAASVMAGSGDLDVMRRLRALHGRTDRDTPFGSHLAAHMALGTLFLAGGTRSLGTSNLAVASLCIAFYPLFPNDVLDNRGHLQALRHLWVLAVESRCLVARDGGAGGYIVGGVSATVHLKDGTTEVVRVPGLVPELDSIKSIHVQGEGFWDGVVDLDGAESQTAALRAQIQREHAINVWLRRRAAYDRPAQQLFSAELQALSDAQGVPSIDPNSMATYHTATTGGSSSMAGPGGNPFEWLFDLPALRDFDHAERALVLGPLPMGDWNTGNLLRTTVVDARLELEKGILSAEDRSAAEPQLRRDHLWQLRLLFAWFDRWEKEDDEIEVRQQRRHREQETQLVQNGGALDLDVMLHDEDEGSKWFSNKGGTWLRKEVIERLRWKVWDMATGGDESTGDNDTEERYV